MLSSTFLLPKVRQHSAVLVGAIDCYASIVFAAAGMITLLLLRVEALIMPPAVEDTF
jgi:hypothetical protein